MYAVESYAAVRRFVFVEGRSQREASQVFRLSRETVAKICLFSLPPGYTRTKPVDKPKLGPLLPVINAILAADRTAPVNQRHTAKRIPGAGFRPACRSSPRLSRIAQQGPALTAIDDPELEPPLT